METLISTIDYGVLYSIDGEVGIVSDTLDENNH
jgi:hypothetical protein